jgi:hypothetical protein
MADKKSAWRRLSIMTLEITEFRCPTCGHILGEEEHRHALSKHEELRKELANKYQEEMQQERVKYQREKQQLQIENQQLHKEFQNRVNVEVQSQIDDIRSEEQEKNQQKIRKKNGEIESLKSQNEQLKSQNEQVTSEAIDRAQIRRDNEWRQEKKQYQEQIERAQKDNMKLQNTLDSIPPELRGTSGERILTEDLHKAFPRDVLEEKRVGEEMPDTIQTIMTENGERIATPILWDMKTGAIKTHDIEKAKRYKEKYNTDYCILVTSRPIAAKFSKNGLIGRSDDGTMLLHKSIAVETANEIRNFIIKETRLVKNNNGRTSKQFRLYDYITSPARLRKIQRIRKNKEELEDLIRRQTEYNIEKWKKQGELIKEWYKLGSDDQETIDDITQQDQASEEERPKKDEEDR